QTAEITISRNIVKSVIVYANMGDMGCHITNRLLSPQFEKFFIVSGIKLQERPPNMEALCPFCPTARCIATLHSENGCAVLHIPGLKGSANFARRQLEKSLNLGKQFSRR